MSEYTPTVWRTGDVITAEKLNKIEEGIANAESGGESDFSAAEVVVTNNTLTNLNGSLPNCDDENDFHILNPLVILSGSETKTLKVPLYKGHTWAYFQYHSNATLTGNITNDGDGYYIITGNGTITIDGEI